MPKVSAPLLALLLCLAVLLSACGGDDEASSGDESSLTADAPCESVDMPEPQEFDLEPPPN
ncbi:MAG: hypothetical protein WKF62_05960, partial [Solirubrobacterales bacterium]